MNEPPPSADTGRTPRGTFAPGNQFSTGNPHASKVQKLRTAMLQAITETDVQVIIAKLIDLARDGDLKAMALLFSIVGKPSDADIKAESHSPEQRGEMIQRISERMRAARESEACEQPAA